ncbi:histidine--tRNA ligase [uncultured Psychroserpens sp.]|uniref:histidine--tRNA ligase n=1 Tax=uncultured Psychroserpens sp. TaxID=255436 RepID=UPI0026180E11|nr:histidine--tRNA ligase [uncultured Psychroserpens sp.]
MAQKPSIPKGTRDFNPQDVAKRNYIFSTIRSAFETFGFQPIETPSFENSSTLMGKYGEEGDRLIFKILNSGDYLKDLRSDIKESYVFSLIFTEIIDSIERLIRIDKDLFSYEEHINGALELYKNITPVEKELLLLYFKENKEDIFSLFTTEINDAGVFSQVIVRKRNLIIDIYNRYLNKEEIFYLPRATKKISEKALRYDLTVPFARYVVQHQNEIDFPFKRYQIQPVWRADRPQKGRFREFFQCDADVVGSNSLWQEVEFVQLYDAVFTALGLHGVTIKINNRKILSGIAEVIGAQDKLIDFTVALDKLDKIGEEKVKEEMLGKGIPQSGIDKLQPLFSLSGDFGAQVTELKSILETSEEGRQGIEELEFINKGIEALGLKTATLQLDVTLARGLNYYTGAIFEVAAPEGVKMGSIGGGGRYDDLTGIFGLKDMSGVGISFGLDRIALVLEQLNLFPETITNTVKVMFINFGEAEAMASMKAIKVLRENDISAELFPDKKKTVKQFNYANKRNIPFVVLVGESELADNTYTLKNMASSAQETITLDALIFALK